MGGGCAEGAKGRKCGEGADHLGGLHVVLVLSFVGCIQMAGMNDNETVERLLGMKIVF